MLLAEIAFLEMRRSRLLRVDSLRRLRPLLDLLREDLIASCTDRRLDAFAAWGSNRILSLGVRGAFVMVF